MSVYPQGVEVLRSARISSDKLFRYSLVRSWAEWDEEGGVLPFIMLNPSTADGADDDPTIRRCVGLARALGYTGIFVANLFAYRATRPASMWDHEKEGHDIVGPENDQVLQMILEVSAELGQPVVAAWGAAPQAEDRVRSLLRFPHADRLRSFALTASGAPRHPLYLPAGSELSPWPSPTVGSW